MQLKLFLRNRPQSAAWAGMIGSLLFVIVFVIEGWLRLGYDPASMFVSELSLGPRGWIQITNFIVLGVLFLLFTFGVAAEFRDGKASKAGPILLAIIGFSFLVSGPIVMDPAATPAAELSWHGWLHNIFGALVFALSPISCFVFYRRFRVDPQWKSLRWWTLAAGVIITVSVILMKVGQAPPPMSPSVFSAGIGLIQRLALITYLAWIFTFALGLRRQSQHH